MKSTLIKKKKNPVRIKTAARWLLFVLSCAVSVLILSLSREPVRWALFVRDGEPSPRTIFAPFGLTVVNQRATLAQREAASRAVPDVYTIDAELNARLNSDLEETFALFRKQKAHPSSGDQWGDSLRVNLSGSQIQAILEDDPAALHSWAGTAARKYWESGLLDFTGKMMLLNEGKKEIALRGLPGPDKEKTVSLRQVATPSAALEDLNRRLAVDFPKNRKLRSALSGLMAEILKPNLKFNEAETQARQKKAFQDVPDITEEIKKNQIIVQKGTIVTPEIHEKLRAVEAKRRTQQILQKVLGTFLIVLAGYVLFALYLRFFDRALFGDLKRQSLMHLLLILVLVAERFALEFPYGYAAYLLPASVFPVALSLLLNRRIGVPAAVLIAVLNAVLTDFNPEVVLYSVMGGMVGIFAAIGLRKRSQFLKVSLAIGLANFFVIFGYNAIREIPLPEAAQLGVYGIVNGFLISMPLLFVLLPVLEHLFGLVTDITLLELSDLNHPLLRKMVIEAPGTYHHSLVVSSLAEAACQTIGANSLLARVGGYFHDIGKIEKSQYFTENQISKETDRHGRLSPSMSYLVIASHVKDGIEMAKKYKLKEAIIDFIPQHQGTCPVYYFYKKAADGAQAADEKVNIDDYRYPGPKPQSKETAVVLLADSVEAASRSLAHITPASIEDMVKEVINGKFIDGQLEECNLSLQDVRKIQDSFVHNLIGIFHTRIQYPKSDAEPLWQKIVERKTE
ncbi:MAG: HDIG domain-containing protein [Candidatus Omnitrophica bacterium]|nr:HDIG domain-containing protein [Candidatus Omnitrophota bacterium]